MHHFEKLMVHGNSALPGCVETLPCLPRSMFQVEPSFVEGHSVKLGSMAQSSTCSHAGLHWFADGIGAVVCRSGLLS